jgi:hypothetical protein
MRAAIEHFSYIEKLATLTLQCLELAPVAGCASSGLGRFITDNENIDL